MKLDALMAAQIPSSFEPGAWRKFFEFVEVDPSSAYARAAKQAYTEFNAAADGKLYHKAVGDKAGWTVDNYTAAIKWYKTELEKFEKAQENFAPKLQHVAKWLKENDKNKSPEAREVRKYINRTLGKSVHLVHETHEILEEVDSILKNASKMFKAKDAE